MDLSDVVFEDYFANKISKEELLYRIGSDTPKFGVNLERELKQVTLKKSGRRLEYLIYVLLLTEDKVNLAYFVDILNHLILCDWHEQHENIAILIQKIHSPKSVKYLREAMYLRPQYLNWDDNYAFEVKCIWALGYIGNSEAKEVLYQIATDSNKILAQNAKQQLSRMQNSVHYEC